MYQDLQKTIEQAFENRAEYTPTNAPAEVREAVNEAIQLLDSGTLRVAEREAIGQWKVNEWLKKAVLLSFRLEDNQVIESPDTKYFDKVPSKFANWSEEAFRNAGIRVVPPAMARKGSYIASGTVLMPSYVNIGA